MELLKLLSANEIIAEVISFLVLLVILRTFLWKRVLGILDARREKISGELNKVEDAKADIDKIRADYESRIKDIEDVATKKIGEAISEGKRVSEELRQGAERDAKTLLDNAKLAIKDEISKAREELKTDIVNIAIEAAGKVIEEKLTPEEDGKIVEDFLKRMESA